VEIGGIAYRSDRVRPEDAFFCIPGFSHDGHDFAADAVARGAAALVVKRLLPLPVPQFVVSNVRASLAHASATYYGRPSEAMSVVGVTGTNGKTTTAYLVDSVMRHGGLTTGIIGTVETRIGADKLPSARTTPESADLQEILATMRDAGVGGCAMEVSSHAIDLRRVDAMRFACVAFTNLTQDHLDFHHTLEEYAAVKKRLFTEFDVGARVVNVDDPFGSGIANAIPGCITVGNAKDALIRAEEVFLEASGSSFVLATPDGSFPVRLPLAGAFNVSNALVAAGCGAALGLGWNVVIAGLESAPQVPGRLERIECGQPFSVVVDYAHTPDSLQKAIAAIRTVCGGRLIVVFGCGGDRDPDKRPMMGQAAAHAADHVIVTSDNPRSEDPVGIILQVEDGVRQGPASYELVVDRRAAIETAISMASAGDAVLIAGKGHEDYQEFADRRVHFDDREVAREVLGC
jgi:UDP-N-acetylmuramoyl-L-alanyl-D-glutamate--2,6-diaminopimelate ligase